MKTALITGCRSGFGHRLAHRLLDADWHVVATDPVLDGWADALPHPERQTIAALDVRDDAAVQRVVGSLDRLDLLVNNGGYAVFGSLEEVPVAQVADLFDVNVMGVVRMTQAALPLLRASQGTVVHLSSMAGRSVFPESGYYAATKYAVEALGEALIQEAGPLGVRVRLVEPGSFATRFLDTASARSPAAPDDSPYAAVRPRWTQRKLSALELPQDPMQVVDAILTSLDRDVPFERVVVGPDAVRMLAARDLLGPDGFSRWCAARNGVTGALDAHPLDDATEQALAALGFPPEEAR